MTTGLIITLVVIVLLAIIVAAVVLPRQRQAKARKAEERRLKAQEHLEESKARAARAEAERAAAAQQTAQAQARRAEMEQELAIEEREANDRKRRADVEQAEAERLAQEARRLSPDIDVVGAPGDHRIQDMDTAQAEAHREDRVHSDRKERAAAYVADVDDTDGRRDGLAADDRVDERVAAEDATTHEGRPVERDATVRTDARQDDPDREVEVHDAETQEKVGGGRLSRFRRERAGR